MARLKLTATSGEVSMVASTAKTILQIKAATNQGVLLSRLTFAGKDAPGATNPPTLWTMSRSTANFGTATGTVTPNKVNPSDGETIQTTASNNFTVEPTTPTAQGWNDEISPQMTKTIPFNPPLEIPGSQAINITGTAASTGNSTWNVTAEFEE